ncbi:MAG: hypothetical protein CMI09_11090 [Oceanospirillaceae bacterium]|nr:hypothetical protein [Oceanospirillaceae bacterium]
MSESKSGPFNAITRLLQSFWPRTLFARLILLMLVTLVAVQSLSVAIYLRDRHELIDSASDRHTRHRVAALIRLMDQSRPYQYRTILKATRNDETSVSITPMPLVERPAMHGPAGHMEMRLMQRTQRPLELPVHISLKVVEERCEDESDDDHHPWKQSYRNDRSGYDDNHPYGQSGHEGQSFFQRFSDRDDDRDHRSYDKHRKPRIMSWSVTVSARLKTGEWLNIRVGRHDNDQVWDWRAAQGLLLVGILVIGLMVWLVKSNTRPLRRLADTAEQIGRGQEPEPLAEQGAEEVRSTIRAFNTMQEKQQRFIKDRVLMLAAISHDLKTPLTKLRLQSEFITDPELQQQQQRTLSDMEDMLNATMAFARDDDQSEPSRDVELVSLTLSVCDDYIANGANLTTSLPERLVYHCRPTGIRRLFTNVVDNAVKYAPSAHIELKAENGWIEIIVTDTGPGIPDELKEQVFRPFFRVEASRNRETGGMGLGLSVVRSTALLHGGDVTLENVTPQGLKVTVRLPCDGG